MPVMSRPTMRARMVSVPSKLWMAPRPATCLTTRWSSSGQPHPLAAGPFCAGQPAAIGGTSWIRHSALRRPSPELVTPRS